MCIVTSSPDILISPKLKVFLICLTPLLAHIPQPLFSWLGIKWLSQNYIVSGETKCLGQVFLYQRQHHTFLLDAAELLSHIFTPIVS